MDVSALTRKAASQGAASYRDVGLIDLQRIGLQLEAELGSALLEPTS